MCVHSHRPHALGNRSARQPRTFHSRHRSRSPGGGFRGTSSLRCDACGPLDHTFSLPQTSITPLVRAEGVSGSVYRQWRPNALPVGPWAEPSSTWTAMHGGHHHKHTCRHGEHPAGTRQCSRGAGSRWRPMISLRSQEPGAGSREPDNLSCALVCRQTRRHKGGRERASCEPMLSLLRYYYTTRKPGV